MVWEPLARDVRLGPEVALGGDSNLKEIVQAVSRRNHGAMVDTKSRSVLARAQANGQEAKTFNRCPYGFQESSLSARPCVGR